MRIKQPASALKNKPPN